MTYACQLRCTHCYTESGRRATRKLPRAELLQIAETIVGMKVERVMLVGGEPLLVPELFEVIERLRAGHVPVSCFSNGIDLTDADARAFAELGPTVHISLDGATAEVNDAIRKRAGAFDATLASLRRLDAVAAERRAAGLPRLRYGLEVVLVRSNFHQISQICTELLPSLRELSFVSFGAVIPIGLASEERFGQELLTDAQIAVLGDPAFIRALKELLPPHIEDFSIFDNQELQVHTRYSTLSNNYRYLMEIEPDGEVRGFAACEGTIGNILRESPELLWERCRARVSDPAIVDRLSAVRTAREWAAAVRAIDRQFAGPEALVRLNRRGGGAS
ncbi:MAG: radical SAM protein [Myxococcota bacterium]|nr:radical SAM protein [Myxococcota bacterium]